MKALLFYLLQVIIISGILYAYYHFALRNERFHKYNRFYLLTASVLSILIPFLNIPVYFSANRADSSPLLRTLTFISSGADDGVTIKAAHQTISSPQGLTPQVILLTVYAVIVCIAMARIILSLLKIRRIIRANPARTIDSIRFINTAEPGTPFSFFRWLFWNNKIELDSVRGEQIFRHEVFHIRQQHSADVMYLELLTALCWINPFFHLMKKETRAIHEFLADRFAIRQTDKWQYAETLLMQALKTNQPLVNPFFHNQIKRRIAMITTSNKTGHRYIRKILVLPLAALLVALFAFTYRTSGHLNGRNKTSSNEMPPSADTAGQNYPDTIIWINGHAVKTDVKTLASPARRTPSPEEMKTWMDAGKYGVWVDGKRITNKNLASYNANDFSLYYVSKLEKNAINYGKHYYEVNLYSENYYRKNFPSDSIKVQFHHVIKDTSTPAEPVFGKTEIGPSFPGGDDKWRLYLERMLDASIPVKKKAPENSYTAMIRFIVDKQGNITEVTPLTHHGYGMEEEAMRVIKSGPKWVPAIQNGKQVNAYKIQPITFVVSSGKKANSVSDEKASNALNEIAAPSFENSNATPPKFPGGETAWRNYLVRNLNAAMPVDSGAPPGVYKVVVKFKVAADGSLSGFLPSTHFGFGMENEVLRILKNGPKWIPATENNKPVEAITQQPVTFVIESDAETPAPKKTGVRNGG